MNKLDMESKNIIQGNTKKLEELFPNCFTSEGLDFDLLKQELSDYIIDNKKERYEISWPGKKEAILDANTPSKNTLIPLKDKSSDYENTQNVYIEGDNLEVLKILQESYLSKIDCIYIDPPYNTGNNLIYKNDFSQEIDEYNETTDLYDNGVKLTTNNDNNGRFHSDWLSMMYKRLKLARNLLSKKGCIVIAIDHCELMNLVRICDEIYGEKNKIGIVAVQHNPEGRQNAKYLTYTHEYFIIYAKNQECFEFNKVVLQENKKESADLTKIYPYSDEKGMYKLDNYIRLAGGYDSSREGKPTCWYPLYVSPDLKEITTTKHDGWHEVFPITNAGQERTWKLIKSSTDDKIKRGELFAKEENGKVQIFERYGMDKGSPITSCWINSKYNSKKYGTNLLIELFGDKVFDYPKSLYLVEDIIELLCDKDSLIMDFFPGSATTAHAVMELNAKDKGKRRFILAQLPEMIDNESLKKKFGFKTICDIGEARIKKSALKVKQETGAEIDYGFRVFKVDSSNMKDVYYKPNEVSQMNLLDYISNIKEDRSSEDLLSQVMLDLGLTLDLKIEEKNILSNKVFYIENNSLVACFDDQVDINIIDEICKCNPMKVVFKDISFKTDKDKINLEERIKKLSPETEINIL